MNTELKGSIIVVVYITMSILADIFAPWEWHWYSSVGLIGYVMFVVCIWNVIKAVAIKLLKR